MWFDNEPCLFYRQHEDNVVGSNDGLKAQITRFRPLFEGRFKQWSGMNISAVHDLQNLVTKQTQQILTEFLVIRSATSLLERLRVFYKSPIRRQRTLSNATLVIAIILKLI